jgi:hypothetical protein
MPLSVVRARDRQFPPETRKPSWNGQSLGSTHMPQRSTKPVLPYSSLRSEHWTTRTMTELLSRLAQDGDRIPLIPSKILRKRGKAGGRNTTTGKEYLAAMIVGNSEGKRMFTVWGPKTHQKGHEHGKPELDSETILHGTGGQKVNIKAFWLLSKYYISSLPTPTSPATIISINTSGAWLVWPTTGTYCVSKLAAFQ